MKAEAKRQGISGRELGRRMGATAPYIARRLSGEVEFTATDLERVAAILHVPVAHFFGEATDSKDRGGRRRGTGRAA